MFVFEYDHKNYDILLRDVAQKLGTPYANGRFQFPRQVAIGFMQLVELQNQLQDIVFDYTVTGLIRIRRKKNTDEFYTLWCYDISVGEKARVEIDNDKYQSANAPFSMVMLTSSLFDAGIEANEGTRIHGINILLVKEWVARYLGMNAGSELLRNYLSMKASRITMEPLDTEYRRLIQEVMDLADGNEPFKKIAVQNRVMLLIERFFIRIASKMKETKNNFRLSREDINRVMQVESILTKDLFKPAPFIPELARMVHISETKLKNDFKTVYGMPIYRYFQKARMHAARDVLLTGKYSIKQVAQEMGFANMNNFTIAFKKEFGMLPSHVE
jgi:AraC-like DNA-binding protein